MTISINSRDPAIQDLMQQLNAQAGHVGISPQGALPGGVAPFSLASRWTGEAMVFHPADSSGQFKQGISIPRNVTYYTGLTSTAAAPTTAELPNDGSFGWHHNTLTGNYYFAYNDGGVIRYPSFASITGNIQDIPGQITAGQHGNLTSGTLHSFAVISGSISAAQHDNQTNGGLHAAVVAAGASGFMTGADKTKLNNYPADCTTVYNDSNAVQRSGGLINAAGYYVAGTKVVGARDTAWSLTGSYTSRKNLNGATSLPLTNQVLGDVIYSIVETLITHGLMG